MLAGAILAVAPRMGARHFRELIAWQLGFRLQAWILEFCQRPAVKSDRRYRDQLADAGSGICRNISEGFARWTRRDFHNSLRIAMSCHREAESLLDEAVARRMLTAAERRDIGPLLGRCGKAIAALMKSLRERSDRPSATRPTPKRRRAPQLQDSRSVSPHIRTPPADGSDDA